VGGKTINATEKDRVKETLLKNRGVGLEDGNRGTTGPGGKAGEGKNKTARQHRVVNRRVGERSWHERGVSSKKENRKKFTV